MVICYMCYEVSISSLYKYNVPSGVVISLICYVFGIITIPVKVAGGILMRKRIYMFSYIED